MPFGLMPGIPYEEKETTLVPGDDVLFCTDGLVEAHNRRGEMFGSPRLRGLLSESLERGRGLSVTLMEELSHLPGAAPSGANAPTYTSASALSLPSTALFLLLGDR